MVPDLACMCLVDLSTWTAFPRLPADTLSRVLLGVLTSMRESASIVEAANLHVPLLLFCQCDSLMAAKFETYLTPITNSNLNEKVLCPACKALSLKEGKGNAGRTPDTSQILPPSRNHIDSLAALERHYPDDMDAGAQVKSDLFTTFHTDTLDVERLLKWLMWCCSLFAPSAHSSCFLPISFHNENSFGSRYNEKPVESSSKGSSTVIIKRLSAYEC